MLHCDKDGVVNWCIILVEMPLTRFEEYWSNVKLIILSYVILLKNVIVFITIVLYGALLFSTLCPDFMVSNF